MQSFMVSPGPNRREKFNLSPGLADVENQPPLSVADEPNFNRELAPHLRVGSEFTLLCLHFFDFFHW